MPSSSQAIQQAGGQPCAVILFLEMNSAFAATRAALHPADPNLERLILDQCGKRIDLSR